MTQQTKRYIDLVHGAALRKPDATAVVCGEDRLTFKQVHDRVGHLGAAFRAQGLLPGDRIALLADNELENIELYAACLRSDFTLVPLNTRLTDHELNYIVKDCEPALLVSGKNYADTVKRIGTQCGISRLFTTANDSNLGAYEQLLSSADADPGADPTDGNLSVLILYTSGTTGHPKGATIDRTAFSARIMGNVLEMEVKTDEVLLQILPMFHIASFLCNAYFFRGATAVMLPKFDPQGALKLMQQESVTAINGVPTIIKALLDSPSIESYDPSRLRLITYGGAPIDPPLLRKALTTFACGFQQHYGMTEAGSVSILRSEDHDPEDTEALTSAGCDSSGYELRIVDEEGRELPRGEPGEIILRGPGLMSKYWGLPVETSKTLANGWMHTGDIGYRDQKGFLHIVDRRTDMIISGGENVYPREVESALAIHPAAPDAAVIGLSDSTWGEVVCCVLTDDAPAEADLEAWLRERIAGYKVPRIWYRVPELPRNATGKVLKNQLREKFSK
jgi:acyl-CoA synthetase (AMP-forming)/AMP-acid ligase II|tara:strand:- start:3657 stop:5174 length:1518 start_codon:yes stop_codon:yes gene_type:complete